MAYQTKVLIMQEVLMNVERDRTYGLYDTLVVSHSRVAEFKRLMSEKPFDERATILGSSVVGHSFIYYCDENGRVTKYFIEGD